MMSSFAVTEAVAPPEPRVLTRHRVPLPALTGLRFVAASWVLVFHTRCADVLAGAGLLRLSHAVRAGKLAVALFFLLSGFILAYTYRGQVRTGEDRRRFFEARFARIWPAYAFSLLLSLVAPPQPMPWGAFARALLMVQAWDPLHPELAGAVNFVCWSLSCEAFFYLLFPWLQWAIVRRAALLQMALLSLALLVAVLANTADQTDGFVPYAGWFRWVPLPVVRMPEFLAGCLMGNLFLEWKGRLPSPYRREGLWTYGGLGVSLLVLGLGLTRWSSLVVVPFVVLLFGLAGERTALQRLLGSKVLVFGGAISYSMYLLQLPAKYYAHVLLGLVGVGDGAGSMALMPVLLVGMAALTFLWLEEPSRRALRWAFARVPGGRASLT